MPIAVAIDCMGGDFGPGVTVPAALQFVSAHADAKVILVGRDADVNAALGKAQGLSATARERVSVRHASEVVRMDHPPAVALRNKKDSSIRIAAELVKAGEVQAFVSAGNTGALMAISRFVLKTLEGIDRPAIVSALPNIKGGSTYML